MSRYNRIKISSNQNESVANVGAKYYITNFYPTIPLSSNDIYVITDFGDRLDTLASQFYGDSNLYWIISSANPNAISGDTLSLKGGIQLRIPADVNSIVSNYNTSNTIGNRINRSPIGVENRPPGSSGRSSSSSGMGKKSL